MNKATVKWLVTIIMAMVCATGWASQSIAGSTEKFIGKWDNHAGIISFFLQNTAGKKQLRMLAADETADTRIEFNLLRGDVDDLEELVEIALYEARNLESLPITPSNTKESSKKIGFLDYPNGIIKFFTVTPAETTGYVALRVIAKNSKFECAYWMDKDDLLSLKKLIDKALKEVSDS